MAVGAIVLVCLFGHLGAIGLVGPDEPRYAWIARAMAQTDDWATPKLYGEPWFEKPILYYWAGAVGFALHLPVEWAARLPSALAALVSALAIGWLGWKNYPSEREGAFTPALLGPLLFSTSVGAISFARSAGPDTLFTAALTLAMASAAAVLRDLGALRACGERGDSVPQTKRLPLALFGAFLGLAVLAKGPASIVLASGAIGTWAMATRRWKAAVHFGHPIAVGSFCLVALPWYVICALRNPDFLRVFLLEHNFERYLTPVFHHAQPFWFFFPIFLVALLPWTILLFPAALEGARRWSGKSWGTSLGFFFACWAAFPLLFFSFSQSKLPGYILPAIPPAALILGVEFSRVLHNTSAHQRWVLTAIGVSWIALGISSHFLARLPAGANDALGRALLDCELTAIAAGCVVAALAFVRVRTALWCSVLLVAFFVEIAGLRILPALDPYISARHHGELLRSDRHLDRLFTFQLQRSWSFGLGFYLERQVAEWSRSDPEAALVATTPQGLEEIRKDGRFRGELDEAYVGILYVPVLPAPH
jgi:4-amino-4-deoxy-L-arabinose transferase-like glycosyltransferase